MRGRSAENVRCGDDDFGVNEVLVELRVLTLLVRGGDELVALLLDPLPQTKLVLGGSEKTGLLLSVDAALVTLLIAYLRAIGDLPTYIIENEKNLALLRSSCS
jgi:hypothetical protein